MNDPRNNPDELDRLLAALVDGTLSYDEQQHLAALLRDDPARQEQYRDYLLLDAMLRWEQPEPTPAEPVRRPWRWRRALFGAVAALAAAVLAAVALWARPPAVHPRPGPAPEPTDDTVAVLLQAPGAVWDGADPPRAGAP